MQASLRAISRNYSFIEVWLFFRVFDLQSESYVFCFGTWQLHNFSYFVIFTVVEMLLLLHLSYFCKMKGEESCDSFRSKSCKIPVLEIVYAKHIEFAFLFSMWRRYLRFQCKSPFDLGQKNCGVNIFRHLVRAQVLVGCSLIFIISTPMSSVLDTFFNPTNKAKCFECLLNRSMYCVLKQIT